MTVCVDNNIQTKFINRGTDWWLPQIGMRRELDERD